MKAKLADTAAPKHTTGEITHASSVLTVILDTPELLNRLLEHPSVTARMEQILEAYEFEVNVDDDVNKVLTPRLEVVTKITTGLHDRLTALETATPAKKVTDKKQLNLL
jgi:hypothetical protein